MFTKRSDFLWPSKGERFMPDSSWLTLHFQLGKQILCLFENWALGNIVNQCWQSPVFLFLVDFYMCVFLTPMGLKVASVVLILSRGFKLWQSASLGRCSLQTPHHCFRKRHSREQDRNLIQTERCTLRMWHWGTRFSGHSGNGLMIGLKRFFQHWWFYNSIILILMGSICSQDENNRIIRNALFGFMSKPEKYLHSSLLNYSEYDDYFLRLTITIHQDHRKHITKIGIHLTLLWVPGCIFVLQFQAAEILHFSCSVKQLDRSRSVYNCVLPLSFYCSPCWAWWKAYCFMLSHSSYCLWNNLIYAIC